MRYVDYRKQRQSSHCLALLQPCAEVFSKIMLWAFTVLWMLCAFLSDLQVYMYEGEFMRVQLRKFWTSGKLGNP